MAAGCPPLRETWRSTERRSSKLDGSMQALAGPGYPCRRACGGARFYRLLYPHGCPATAEILRSPFTLVGQSDAGAHLIYHAGYGYATRFLGYWIRENKVMGLEEGIRKLTFSWPRFLVSPIEVLFGREGQPTWFFLILEPFASASRKIPGTRVS